MTVEIISMEPRGVNGQGQTRGWTWSCSMPAMMTSDVQSRGSSETAGREERGDDEKAFRKT